MRLVMQGRFLGLATALLVAFIALPAASACDNAPDSTDAQARPTIGAGSQPDSEGSEEQGDPARGEPLSLQEYLGRMDALVLDMTQELDRAEEDLADELATVLRAAQSGDDEAPARAALPYAKERLRNQASALRRAIDGMKGITPPMEAARLHAKAVRAGEEIVEASEYFVGRLEGLEAADDLETLETLVAKLEAEVDLQTPGERLEDACYGLEELAEAHNLDANLQCSLLSLTF